MADITNPQAIVFCNEKLRPICETARAFKAMVGDLSTEWYSGINTVIGSSADDTLIDDRAESGVSVLTGADITTAVSNLLAAIAALNDAVIELPTVRGLQVTLG